MTLSQTNGVVQENTMIIDPATLTASAIATLAFQGAIRGGAGKFTEYAIAKMGQLRELIWNRLTGKHPEAGVALDKAKAGEQEGIDTVIILLGLEMQDKAFAGQVQAIAQEINAGKLLDQSSMVMNVNDEATGYMVKNEGGENYTGNITINKT
jgi:hypothetical protein